MRGRGLRTVSGKWVTERWAKVGRSYTYIGVLSHQVSQHFPYKFPEEFRAAGGPHPPLAQFALP